MAEARNKRVTSLQAEHDRLSKDLADLEKRHPERARAAAKTATRAKLASQYEDLVQAGIEQGLSRQKAVAAAGRACPEGRAAFLTRTNPRRMKGAIQAAADAAAEDEEESQEQEEEDEDEDDDDDEKEEKAEDENKAGKFEKKVKEETKKNGGDRKAAIATVARGNKALHSAYLRHVSRLAKC
jgi:hypothetical protein